MKTYIHGYDRAKALISALDRVNKKQEEERIKAKERHTIKIMGHSRYRYMWE